MSAGVKIEGLEELLAAFTQLGSSAAKEGAKATAAMGEKVRGDAVKSIQRGEKTGRVYERAAGNNLSPIHQASAAGEAPATDTGNLVSSSKVVTSGLSGMVKFTADYAYWLEFGTRLLEPRPFLQPALDSNTGYYIDRLQRGLDKATQEFNAS